MLKNIIKFELRYLKARPTTYLYFLIIFILAFIFTATPIKESLLMGGQVKENGTLPLFVLSYFLGIISIFIVSAVMGVAINRDFEHNMEALFFTTSIKKFDYLFGRFLGSFFVLCLILLGIPLGLMIGQLMPWQVTYHMSEFRLLNYFNLYFLILLPNAFILSSIFFLVGALSRKIIYVYLQGLTVLMLNQYFNSFLNKVSYKKLISWLDPLGLQSASIQSRYWRIHEKNFQDISLSGDLLYNRLIWGFLAVLCLIATYNFFTFTKVFNSNNNQKSDVIIKNEFDEAPIPFSIKNFENYSSKILILSNIYFLERFKNIFYFSLIPIILIVFFAYCGKGNYKYGLNLFIPMVRDGLFINTSIFPICFILIYIYDLFLLKNCFIFDLLPLEYSAILCAKFIALSLTFVVLMLVWILFFVSMQSILCYIDHIHSLYLLY